MVQLTTTQQLQENEYSFPYHYMDLAENPLTIFWSIEYLSYINIVKNIIKPTSNKTILDAGCGDGRFCYEMNKVGAKIVGIDFSESAIRFAKAFNPNIEFLVQDIKDIDLPYQFDYVVLIETLEHFIPEQIPKILVDLSNVMERDGTLIVTVPSTKSPLTEKHYQHFTEELLLRTLEPYFNVENILGYSKSGNRRSLFIIFCGIGFFLLPFRNKIKFVKRYFAFLNNYYHKYLSSGDSKECLGLIAICKKRSCI